jgi:hypothetical protein
MKLIVVFMKQLNQSECMKESNLTDILTASSTLRRQLPLCQLFLEPQILLPGSVAMPTTLKGRSFIVLSAVAELVEFNPLKLNCWEISDGSSGEVFDILLAGQILNDQVS